jgi:uncharacterized protein (TIGR02246 family)
MKRSFVAVAGLLAAATAGFLMARDTPATVRPADEHAVREAAQAFARAFEKGDVQAVATAFTEEGEYVDEGGTPIHGREALGKAYTAFFAKRPELKAESKTDSVRFLGQDTALEEGTFTVRAKDTPPTTARYSALWARQGGRWQMALLKEWTDDATERASLNDLAWLIGTWESDGPDLTARTAYEWAEGKHFIRARYTITPKKAGGSATSGTQVFGVDPATGLIRSWTFDGDGGIGEATWTWDEGRWAIQSTGTLADGSPTTALNLLTRAGDDAFTWRSTNRTVNGRSLPDIGPVTVKRTTGGK